MTALSRKRIEAQAVTAFVVATAAQSSENRLAELPAYKKKLDMGFLVLACLDRCSANALATTCRQWKLFREKSPISQALLQVHFGASFSQASEKVPRDFFWNQYKQLMANQAGWLFQRCVQHRVDFKMPPAATSPHKGLLHKKFAPACYSVPFVREDGELLMTVAVNRRVEMRETSTNRCVFQSNYATQVRALALGMDLLAVGLLDGSVTVWDRRSEVLEHTPTLLAVPLRGDFRKVGMTPSDPQKMVQNLFISAAGMVVAAYDKESMSVWNPANLERATASLDIPDYLIKKAELTPSGERLITSGIVTSTVERFAQVESESDELKIDFIAWDFLKDEHYSFSVPGFGSQFLALSENELLLARQLADGSPFVLCSVNIASGEVHDLVQLPDKTEVTDMTLGRGRIVYIATNKNKVLMWDVDSKSLLPNRIQYKSLPKGESRTLVLSSTEDAFSMLTAENGVVESYRFLPWDIQKVRKTEQEAATAAATARAAVPRIKPVESAPASAAALIQALGAPLNVGAVRQKVDREAELAARAERAAKAALAKQKEAPPTAANATAVRKPKVDRELELAARAERGAKAALKRPEEAPSPSAARKQKLELAAKAKRAEAAAADREAQEVARAALAQAAAAAKAEDNAKAILGQASVRRQRLEREAAAAVQAEEAARAALATAQSETREVTAKAKAATAQAEIATANLKKRKAEDEEAAKAALAARANSREPANEQAAAGSGAAAPAMRKRRRIEPSSAAAEGGGKVGQVVAKAMPKGTAAAAKQKREVVVVGSNSI